MSGFFLFEDARVFFTPAPVKTIMRKDDVAMIMGTTEDLIIRKCQSAARKSMLIYLVFFYVFRVCKRKKSWIRIGQDCHSKSEWQSSGHSGRAARL